MMRYLRAFAMGAPLLVAVAAETALAQKTGGILKLYNIDNPPSMSVHEETAASATRPIMWDL